MHECGINRQEKQDLEKQHKRERDRRVADWIKAVLLHTEGWSQIQIAQALRLHVDTVHDHLEDYKKSRKLKLENGGSQSLLPPEQAAELIRHLIPKSKPYWALREDDEWVRAKQPLFPHVKEFRKTISHFFDVTWPQIAHAMIDRIVEGA